MLEDWKLTDQERAELNARGGDMVEAQKAKKEAYIKAGGIINPLEDIRLTPREIEDGINNRDEIHLCDRVANTATDKANKWWVEYLSRRSWRSKKGFMGNTEQMWNTSLTYDEYEALKKLVKE